MGFKPKRTHELPGGRTRGGTHKSPLADVDSLNFVEGERRAPQHLVLPEGWPLLSYKNGSQPVHLDVGCARGGFCLSYAVRNPTINVLGLEVMQRKVQLANVRRRQMSLPNCFFLLGDATVHL